MQIRNNQTIQKMIKTVKNMGEPVDVFAQSAQLTFYFLLALVPLLFVIVTLIPFLPIQYDSLLKYVNELLPPNINTLVVAILTDYFTKANGSSLSLGIILSLWSSSQIFGSLQKVFNTLYQTNPRRHFIINRLVAFVFALLFVCLMLGIGLTFTFGTLILNVLQENLLLREGILIIFNNSKWIAAFIGLFIVYFFLYTLLPNVKRQWRFALPGSLFSSLGSMLATQIYALYVARASNNALTDGTIGVFIVLMLWLYVLCIVILLGAWLNVFVYNYIYPPELKRHPHQVYDQLDVYYSKRQEKGRSK